MSDTSGWAKLDNFIDFPFEIGGRLDFEYRHGAEDLGIPIPIYLENLAIGHQATIIHAVNVILDFYPEGVTSDTVEVVLNEVEQDWLQDWLILHLLDRIKQGGIIVH